MLEIMGSTLFNLLTWPFALWTMLLGTLIGIVVGILPGLGGRLAIALMIPFVFGMDMIPGAVFLLSLHAVTGTSGQFTSIMFGVPGEGDAAATIVDGYPMAKQGKAGLALGASLMASGIGGVLGALFLAIMIPVVKPIVLAFSPAEFFLLALLGITFIAYVSGNDIFKGIIVGLMGLMLSFIGMDPQTGTARYSEHFLFMWDGIDLISAVLAIFAVPEMIALGVRGGSISNVSRATSGYDMKQVFQGCRETFNHWGLVFRTSLIGAVIGVIPGLGGSAASWFCYGHAVQTSKHPERFGHGAIEGVIAPETANNSKEGGSLLPTLFFGVPGSSGMAILLGAFLILGIQPGADMMTKNLDVVWYLIWALVLSNILAVAILIFACRWVTLLTFVRGGLLIPFILVICVMGTYLAAGQWENLVVLALLSILGYGLLHYNWPRAPFVLGMVLGRIAEESLHKALNLWGLEFFLRPLSLVLIGLILATIGWAIYKGRGPKMPDTAAMGGG